MLAILTILALCLGIVPEPIAAPVPEPCVYLADRHTFPSAEHCTAWINAAERARERCLRERWRQDDLAHVTAWDAAIAEIDRRLELWRELRMVQLPAWTAIDEQRLRGLYRTLGPTDYFAGRMPSPVPFELLPEK